VTILHSFKLLRNLPLPQPTPLKTLIQESFYHSPPTHSNKGYTFFRTCLQQSCKFFLQNCSSSYSSSYSNLRKTKLNTPRTPPPTTTLQNKTVTQSWRTKQTPLTHSLTHSLTPEEKIHSQFFFSKLHPTSHFISSCVIAECRDTKTFWPSQLHLLDQ
jgi:hypothetical protein